MNPNATMEGTTANVLQPTFGSTATPSAYWQFPRRLGSRSLGVLQQQSLPATPGEASGNHWDFATKTKKRCLNGNIYMEYEYIYIYEWDIDVISGISVQVETNGPTKPI